LPEWKINIVTEHLANGIRVGSMPYLLVAGKPPGDEARNSFCINAHGVFGGTGLFGRDDMETLPRIIAKGATS
jgi:hypothetical protein